MSSKPEWMREAEEKKLPEKFVQTLAESDGFSEAQKAVFVAHVTDAADLEAKRKTAIEIGRRYGTHEADSRGEVGHDRDQRIRRAMAYAAWEFDGKPLSSKEQREEMGVLSPDIPGYTDQAELWRARGESK